MTPRHGNTQRAATTQLERVTAHFDGQADYYAARYSTRSSEGYGFLVRRRRVLELISGTGGTVLDVGCGPGVMVPDLTRMGFEFWGVDASRNMIDECRRAFGDSHRAHFAVGNATALAFPDGFFDVVTCMGVIDRIEIPDLAIREMHRVLKPGGICIITFPNMFSPNEFWRRYIYNPTGDFVKLWYSRVTGRARPPRLSSFVRLHRESVSYGQVRKHFGSVTDCRYFNFNVMLSPLDQLFPRTAMKVAENLERQCSGRLRWMGTGFILKAVKASSEASSAVRVGGENNT